MTERKARKTEGPQTKEDCPSLRDELSILQDNYKEARIRLANLSKRLFDTQEALKAEIARELHDEVGQLLTAIKIQLQGIQASSETVDKKLRPAIQTIDRLMSIVRGMSSWT